MFIKNRKELEENIECSKCREARKKILDTLEVVLKAADPEKAVKKNVSIGNGFVEICGEKFRFNRLYVIGFGKASRGMAKAVEEVFGNMIAEGVIALPKQLSKKYVLRKIKVIPSSHPIPDESSVKAAKEIVRIAEKACEKDLVLVLISGGGSALAELPRPEISISDLKETTEVLLKSGASIDEINTIRKHLSLFKGGWLAKKIYPATTVSLIISDVVGDPIEFIASGPTAPDSTTFNDALEIVRKYGIENKLPLNVLNILKLGAKGALEETPKPGDKIFEKVHNNIIASNMVSLKAAQQYAKEKLGLNTLILTSRIRGEARHVGVVLASVLEEIYYNDTPLKKPSLILAGGETTVTVVGKGVGGRNQELALSAAKIIRGLHGVALASIGTDGIDGVTEVAGGIVDAHTLNRALNLNMKIDDILSENNSYFLFKKLGDYIYTGPTGTNVNDVFVGVVL